MDIVTSIGWLTIIAIVGGVIFHFMTKKEMSETEYRRLVKNNDKCQELIRKHNNAVAEGRSVLSNTEFQKQLQKILKDPNERQQALDKIEQREKEKAELELDRRNRRKIGYKYETEIFEIFDIERELNHEALIEKIKFKFNTNDNQALKLLRIWYDNGLVSKCNWATKKWEIGYVLTSDIYKIDDNDLTRDTWLKQNGKTLKPESREYLRYYDKL